MKRFQGWMVAFISLALIVGTFSLVLARTDNEEWDHYNEHSFWQAIEIGKGVKLTIINKSTDYTITGNEEASVFSNYGATTAMTYTLPSARRFQGRVFSFLNAEQDVTDKTMNVDPQSTDSIGYFTNSAGDKVTSTKGGSWLQLLAMGSNWVVLSGSNTDYPWTDGD
jgi:hypothetical protein